MKKTHRSKPNEISAKQWTGDNLAELISFFGSIDGIVLTTTHHLRLRTIDNEWVPCPNGHFVVAEPISDHFYPCDPNVMAAKYEELPE